jgi:hypothetical protein
MHSHLEEVLARLDASRTALRQAVAAIDAERRRERPAPGRWSPLEVVEHLALTDRRSIRALGEKIRAALEGGLGEETAAREALPGPMAARIADRTAPRTAPDELHPTATLDEPAAWEMADQARLALREALLRGDGRALSAIVHEHAAFGSLTVYQWVELLAAHELRHVDQIREAHK